MPNTYIKIASTSLTGNQSSVTFSSIPQIYTDLVLKISARYDATADIYLRFNGLNTNLSDKVIYGLRASTVGYNTTNNIRIPLNPSTSTANTFCNSETYIPNYSSSIMHSVSTDGVVEENGTTNNIMWIGVGLWNSATPITEINLVPSSSGNFVANSTFTLYGIKNS